QHRLALLILTQKHRLLFPGLLCGKIGQRVNRYRLPEMQVADVVISPVRWLLRRLSWFSFAFTASSAAAK
ncbi:hypothetical protein PRR79_28750, partial [Klebsiella pneumoniae]|nr:hypothetical protein [Klebsiella pneumoniae]